MKVCLHELAFSRYVYVNPLTNIVHLIMPIMSGIDIGLDNTCKSVYSLREFFGIAGENKQTDAIGVLNRYKQALEHDVHFMPPSHEKVLKVERLAQINHYLSIIKKLQKDPLIRDSLAKDYPSYPTPLQYLMASPQANLHSIILRPAQQDFALRINSIRPIFSLPHDLYFNRQIHEQRSLFYETLITRWKDLRFRAKSKEELVQRVVSKLAGHAVDFEAVRRQLSAEVKVYLGFDCNFNQTQDTSEIASESVNQAYMDAQLAIDADNPATHEAYAHALIYYCVPHLMAAQAGSPFNFINTVERLSIATQLMLAEINLFCYEQGQSSANFGKVLEAHADLGRMMAHVVSHAMQSGVSVELSMIQCVNKYSHVFGLKKMLSLEQAEFIKQRFKAHYEHIKDSSHFDEFMLLSTKPGPFFTHQGCIATSLAVFMSPKFFKTNEETQAFLEERRRDFSRIKMEDNVLPHKNTHLTTTEVHYDLVSMNNAALHSLYEQLTAFPDATIKEQILIQFKQERPDFQPHFYKHVFLKHVAYGQQNAAEGLLKEYPELAQGLLQANNIPFTDNAGRTFDCTAYEYAYWALDSHMQRMLERYMSEESKQFILSRVQNIETPIYPSSLFTCFFSHPKPRGLRYTTINKDGQTKEHRSAHFDLTPLKKVLIRHIQKSEERCFAFNRKNINLAEIGREQHLVPAHIAQEYCHPHRSFAAVAQDKSLLDTSNPDNLERQLTFMTFSPDGSFKEWFSADSRLGAPLGILRENGVYAQGKEQEWSTHLIDDLSVDLAAISAIDEVRTNDLQRSLTNLGSPSNEPLPQSPSFNR